MTTLMHIIALALALSGALNVGFIAGILAKASGKTLPAAVLVAGGAAATALTMYFAAIAVYR